MLFLMKNSPLKMEFQSLKYVVEDEMYMDIRKCTKPQQQWESFEQQHWKQQR